MQNETTYNGWPNYETWAVFTRLSNDEQAYRALAALAQDRQGAVDAHDAEHMASAFLGPELTLCSELRGLDNADVNWQALADAFNEYHEDL